MKQNKIICATIAVILFLACVFAVPAVLTGCSNSETNDEQTNNNSIFVVVQDEIYYDVVYHKDTKVMYVLTTKGFLKMLVNADGTPATYEEEQ